MPETAFCAECQMPYAARDGVIRFHTTMEGRVCPGSRKDPAPAPPPVPIWSYTHG